MYGCTLFSLKHSMVHTHTHTQPLNIHNIPLAVPSMVSVASPSNRDSQLQNIVEIPTLQLESHQCMFVHVCGDRWQTYIV